MKLNRVGFVGWRGLVGSVLLQRMIEEEDFALIEQPIFYTTSQTGQLGPDIGREIQPLQDAFDLHSLKNLDVIVTCQGGDYTSAVYAKLRQQGWKGYWIDASSSLRMATDSTIVLDPVNMPIIERDLANGHKNFIVGNCTVSLMLMALDGLLNFNPSKSNPSKSNPGKSNPGNADLIEWISVASYQAISGGGARQMRELIEQMGVINLAASDLLKNPTSSILDVDKAVIDAMRSDQLPSAHIGVPLAGSLLPWIDQDLDSGTSREEWKGEVETNKILGRDQQPITVESTCIRIGTMRCHSQSFTIKLKKELPLDEIEQMLEQGNDWVSVIENTREASLAKLTPAYVSGTLTIPVGRVRKLNFGARYISAFTVGDQLLWGAAEPLRRMIRILEQHQF